MAPDADKTRQRGSAVQSAANDNNGEHAHEKVASIKSIKSNEVVIDGVIYDITSFDHPGGDSIHIFGGNDATVSYKMIHPYHTSKHLEKMKRVGVVPDYFCEYVQQDTCVALVRRLCNNILTMHPSPLLHDALQIQV
jgi:acyl-lipid (7-3)-desaturase (Delta-4 desaturase)